MSSTSDRARPTLAECKQAARQAGAAPCGRAALLTVRPTGVAGVIRARAPLALVLYVAGIEGRLVWQGPGGFALLEPPLARPEVWQRPRGARLGSLKWLDHHWSTAQFGLPPLFALVVATAMLPFPRLHLAVLLIVLVAMVYTVGVMSIMAVWQIFFGRAENPDVRALGTVSADHWTMPLFHQENEHRIDELLDQVQTRLHRLVADEVRQSAADRGAQVGPVRLSTTLICLRTGVTTDEARLRMEVARNVVVSGGRDGVFSMRMFDARPEDLARRPARPPAFFRFYVFSVVVAVLGLAFLVMAVERGECSPDRCDGAPTTYGKALAWVAYQMVWRDVAGIEPVSGFAVALGWLLSYLVLAVIAVGIVAFRAQSKAVDQENRHFATRQGTIMGSTRVLIVTVADVERDAVLDAIEGHTGEVVNPRYDGPVPVFAMGAINDTEIFVVQAGSQGIANPAGALTVTGDAIRHVAPHYAFIVGICYGLRRNSQQLGDILVSEKIKDLDHGKLIEVDGQVSEQHRGEYVVPSAMLLNAVKAAQRGWSKKSRVHIGPMLAWNRLLNAEPVVQHLLASHPDAIGGDMEGAGFQAAARVAGVESILIKSICDWGADKTDDMQGEAACNAASFVLHLVLTDALAHSPSERRGI